MTKLGNRKHLLLTKELEKKLPPLYANENVKDPLVIVKFFSPYSNWTWYATEGERTEDGDFRFFGLVDGFEKELGYFSLRELEDVTISFGGVKVPGVERDLWFDPEPLSNFS